MAKHSLISAAVTNVVGTADVVAAVGSKRIIVIAYALNGAATATAQWLSAANALSGVMTLPAALAAPGDDSFLFMTNPGEALRLVSAGATSTGHVTYYLSNV